MQDNRNAWIVAGIIFLALISFIVPFGGRWGGFCGMMYNSGYWMMSGFGWVFMALIIVALVFFIVWLAQQLTQNGRRNKS